MVSNPGGFWIRLLGILLDAILIGAVVSLTVFIFALDTSNRIVQTGETIFTILYFVLVPVLWSGYTFGKRIAGVRIVKKDGSSVTILTTLIRYGGAFLIYGISLGAALIVSAFMVALRKDKRAIHDLIAGTYVTYNKT